MPNQLDDKQVIRNALLELRELKHKVKRMEEAQREPIAVIGMDCRFPQADSPAAFWELLRSGADVVDAIPGDRWERDGDDETNLSAQQKTDIHRGAYLDKVYDFDADFFGISTTEAINLDPQQRLLLEVSWSALEHAGIRPSRLSGSETGVYVGYGNRDYVVQMIEADLVLGGDITVITGNDFAFAAGRLSHTLGLQGPSMFVTTACSSSLVSLHLACQALRTGDCDLALAGAVNLILHPATDVMLTKSAILSPDGRCRSFDAQANGFGRGEGCGMVVLKRLSDAQADGDRILALLRGSAVNHDGTKALLTAPNGSAQQRLLKKAFTTANMAPDAIDYIEAHGTGTTLGDAIEAGTLGQFFGSQRPRPLWVGSVKSNLGHLEAAAGIAGLFKVILALQHQIIPPNLHFHEPNPQVPWQRLAIQIPTALTPWIKREQPRAAGISAFGLSGINAHVVVEEAPTPFSENVQSKRAERPLHLLPLSAKTEAALAAQTARYLAYLHDNPALDWGNVCHSTAVGREHFAWRRTVVAASSVEAQALLADAPMTPIVDQSKIAFLFTGEDAALVNMGRELYQTQPTFRATLDRCADLLQQDLEQPLLELLYPDSFGAQRPNPTAESDGRDSPVAIRHSQPALFALEYALAELLRSWGIKPDIVMGQGVGEVVAACVAGLFSLEDGAKLAAVRGYLHQESGAAEVAFARIAQQIAYHQAHLSFFSTLTGGPAHKEAATAEHWIRQAQQPSYVDQALQTMSQRGITAFIEIGPQPVLIEMGQHILPDDVPLWLPTLRPQQEWWQLLTTLGELYCQGVEIDWQSFEQDYTYQWVELPTYPFQRQTYRIPTTSRAVRIANNVSLPAPVSLATDGQSNHDSGTTVVASSASVSPYVAPQTPTEQKLAVMWADLLDIERVGRQDHFFALGGNSVMVTQAVSAMRTAFGIELPLQTLFEQPTLAAVAELIDTQIWATQGIDEDEEGIIEL